MTDITDPYFEEFSKAFDRAVDEMRGALMLAQAELALALKEIKRLREELKKEEQTSPWLQNSNIPCPQGGEL